ncbi:hypothetical protein B0T18DRAFT_16804 [Schizothecium vesticola]|uniref:Uncharacterized protein n=1 Tax=Schizothecium vesticola TaxID=314040 RepID=A0AA40KBV4_9PEZI|nr:hypothetical protein B0T18DRAFT_16804 [Schizothecium vesticola]
MTSNSERSEPVSLNPSDSCNQVRHMANMLSVDALIPMLTLLCYKTLLNGETLTCGPRQVHRRPKTDQTERTSPHVRQRPPPAFPLIRLLGARDKHQLYRLCLGERPRRPPDGRTETGECPSTASLTEFFHESMVFQTCHNTVSREGNKGCGNCIVQGKACSLRELGSGLGIGSGNPNGSANPDLAAKGEEGFGMLQWGQAALCTLGLGSSLFIPLRQSPGGGATLIAACSFASRRERSNHQRRAAARRGTPSIDSIAWRGPSTPPLRPLGVVVRPTAAAGGRTRPGSLRSGTVTLVLAIFVLGGLDRRRARGARAIALRRAMFRFGWGFHVTAR